MRAPCEGYSSKNGSMLVEPRKVAQREGLGVLYLLTCLGCSPECKPENMCRRGCIMGIHDTEGKYESYRGSYEVAGVCFCLGDYLETDILCLCWSGLADICRKHLCLS